MFLKPVPGRVIKYEVSFLKEERWTIESLRDDDRDAIAAAKAIVAQDGIDAVRVVRQRHSPRDIVVESTVFEKQARARGKPEPRLSINVDEDAWCETLDDLYGARSRRAIGQLLRSFLDQTGITPTELLHNQRFLRKLDAAGSLQSGATDRIARARAAATGLSLAECSKALDKIVSQAEGRMREAQAVRAVPKIGEGGLDALYADCKRLAPDSSQQLFWFRHAACRMLEGCNNLLHRIETVMAWQEKATDAEPLALLDALLADCLASTQLVQEGIGIHKDLASALVLLIDLARGRCEATPPRSRDWFPKLATMLKTQDCQEIRTVLLARVRRDLAGERALVRGTDQDEAKALTLIAERLRNDEEGVLIGGIQIVWALARRWSKLDVPGGIGDLPFPDGTPAERFAKLADYAGACFGEAKKRAAATALVDTVREIPGASRAELAPLLAGIVKAKLPEPAVKTIRGELAAAN